MMRFWASMLTLTSPSETSSPLMSCLTKTWVIPVDLSVYV